MKRITAMTLLLLLLLLSGITGCDSDDAHTEPMVSVYYLNAARDTELLNTEPIPLLQEEEAWMQALLAVLRTPDSETLAPAFPSDTGLLDAYLDNRVVHVRLSGGVWGLQGLELTLAKACLVLSLTELEGIDGVRLYQGYTEDTPPLLRAEDFILDALVRPGAEHDFIWYYTDTTGRFMVPEARSLVLRNNEPVAEYIFRELAAGPSVVGFEPVIPPGTTLLSIEVTDKICRLNLSGEFAANASDSPGAARMTLCCIAGSLTALPEIDAVQIFVDDAPLLSYNHWDTSRPITADPFALRRISEGYGSEIALWVPVEEGLLPVYLYAVGYEEKAALDELCDQPPLGAKPIFSADTRILDVVQNGMQYTVTLSEAFLTDLPQAEPGLVVQSIAHVLDGFTPGATVKLVVGDRELTEYFGVSLSPQLRADPTVRIPYP